MDYEGNVTAEMLVMARESMRWRHVGDGVYARFDGYHVVVRTETAGEIYLDPTVFGNLESFADQVWGVDHE